MPWRPGEDREQAIRRALAKLPPSDRRRIDVVPAAKVCVRWPFEPDGRPLIRRLPDVPVLITVGSLDTVTPVSGAEAVARLFPRSQVVIAPGIGHTPLVGWFGTELRRPGSSCVDALEGWAAGVKPRGRCDSEPPLVVPLKPVRKGEPLVIEIARTLIDARNSLNIVSIGEDAKAPGLEAGWVSGRGSDFTLHDYSVVGGLRISGHVTASEDIGYAALDTADLDVAVPGGDEGRLTVELYSSSLTGRVGHRDVSVPLLFDQNT